jgi:hypothetical protein
MQLYYENLFTQRNEWDRLAECRQMFKVKYSKAALYVKLIEGVWGQSGKGNNNSNMEKKSLLSSTQNE